MQNQEKYKILKNFYEDGLLEGITAIFESSVKPDEELSFKFDKGKFTLFNPSISFSDAVKIGQELRKEYGINRFTISSLNVGIFNSDSMLQCYDVVLDDLVLSLLAILHGSDIYTHGHSLRVTQIAMLIATSMGLEESQIQDLYTAACLHDIGKTSIPDNILNKASRLSNEEMVTMQSHSKIGYDIICEYSCFDEISNIILSHHERWDGLGYPSGLVGDEIPLLSRIISVADAFDAITSDRPYRNGQCHLYGVEEIQKHAGNQFDPFCVEHFTKIEKYIIPSNTMEHPGLRLYECKIIHEALMHSKKISETNKIFK